MDVKTILEEQTKLSLMSGGAGWVLAIEALMERIDALEARISGTPEEETDVSPPVQREIEEAPKPNGYKCVFCGRDLHGKQRRFCSKECTNAYAYIKKQNPEASNSDITTIIAGSGVQGPSQKRRKYKKLDQIKSEQAIRRARSSTVPMLG